MSLAGGPNRMHSCHMPGASHTDGAPALRRPTSTRRGVGRPDYSRIADRELGRRIRRGDGRARDVLIERYLPLARKLARRYRRPGEGLDDDLIQVASLGLVKAVHRWEPQRGFAFSSFAVPTILGELRRYLRDTTWAIRPPRELMELALAVERARDPLRARIGREPTTTDLAEHLGRPREAVVRALHATKSRAASSLDSPAMDDPIDAPPIQEVIGDDDAGYAQVEAKHTVDRLTKVLDPRAREILQMRFGDDLYQAQIADRVGISQMHVSRTIRTSVEKMRAYAAGPQPVPSSASEEEEEAAAA
jgi:RNA polymerase sigma-B factor